MRTPLPRQKSGDASEDAPLTQKELAGRVLWDEATRTFRLYGATTLYAFCVDRGGNLNHLHWGEALPPDDDLRYLSFSNEQLCFDPSPFVEFTDMEPILDLVEGREDLSGTDLLREWGAARKGLAGIDPTQETAALDSSLGLAPAIAAEGDAVALARRRNASWRLMRMHEIANEDTDHTFDLENLGLITDGDESVEDEAEERNGGAVNRAARPPRPPKEDTREGESTEQVSEGEDGEDGRGISIRQRRVLDRSPTLGLSGMAASSSSPSLYGMQAASSWTSISKSDFGEGFVPMHASTSIHELSAMGSESPTNSTNILGALDLHKRSPAPRHGGMSPSVRRGSFSGEPPELLLDDPHHANIARLEDLDNILPDVGRNTKLLEYADIGTGDYRPPSFRVAYEDGSTICPLTYREHRIVAGKPSMTAALGKLPELRGGLFGESNTLVVIMEDRLTGLEFHLIYTVYRDVDAVVRRVLVRNPDTSSSNAHGPQGPMWAKDRRKPVTPNGGASTGRTAILSKLMSATVDFHSMSATRLITLSGSWANERHVRMQQLVQGKFVSESMRGTSSHQHNPFFALTSSPEQVVDTVGEVFAFSLVYSGNFIMEAEATESGRTRINAGINPSTFRWHLPAGDAFEGPECVLVYSRAGLEGMSHAYHDLYRRYLIPPQWVGRPCPVLVNTWEAMYFNVSHASVMELAHSALACGVDMIVLDDGWFGERNDPTTSLGDWFENRSKFPGGLADLVRDVNALGLKFGIWVEPEMVSVSSKLYRAHPTWAMNQHGRKSRCEGRNQLVLDLTRKGVREYLLGSLSTVLCSANIEYVKWDMNRHLTEVYGNAVSPEKQGEVFHRYVVGVYEILAALNARFPNVLIETCSGGGGRFDAGMLHYGPQIWASDNTDVFSRLAIQHGTSLVFPVSSISSHITAVPNHQTQRLSPMKTRFLVSLFGSFGIEMDVRKLSAAEAYEISQYAQKYKELAPVVHLGRFYRLWSPSRDSAIKAYAWMCADPGSDGDGAGPVGSLAAVVGVFLAGYEVGHYLPRVKLRGLAEDQAYRVEEIFPNTSMRDRSTGQIHLHGGTPQYQIGLARMRFSGATLMRVGLPVRLAYDGDSCAFELTRLGPL